MLEDVIVYAYQNITKIVCELLKLSMCESVSRAKQSKAS